MIIVNELEFRQLTEADRQSDAALSSLGIPAVVITRGAAGATIAEPGADGRWVRHDVPGVPVRPVDTTGCGDAFTGALAARLVAGAGLVEAVEFAVLVGAYAATGHGAQPSYPTRSQLDDWQASRNDQCRPHESRRTSRTGIRVVSGRSGRSTALSAAAAIWATGCSTAVSAGSL